MIQPQQDCRIVVFIYLFIYFAIPQSERLKMELYRNDSLTADTY